MNTAITIIVVFLVIVFLLSFPTRGRTLRAFTQAEGPHPLIRPFLALGRWQRERRERKRRERLRRV